MMKSGGTEDVTAVTEDSSKFVTKLCYVRVQAMSCPNADAKVMTTFGIPTS